jgi:DNA-binding transcriptional regulator YiaG
MQFIQGQGLDQVLVELRRLHSDKEPPPREPSLSQSLAAGVCSGRFDTPAAEGVPPERAVASAAESAGSASTTDPKTGSDFSTGSQAQYYRSVARLGVQVAEALDYAHSQKVLHRDIKPSNLLLDLQGTVWVTDFGLAKEEGDELTRTGDVVGTLQYMAPERFSGVSDPRSDLYSLGLTLYEFLALRPAFADSDRARLIQRVTTEEPALPRRLDRRVPRDLETIVLKAIAKEPGQRYQKAEELAEDLRRFLADRPIRARRFSLLERTWRLCRRNPLVASLSSVITLLLLVLAGSAWLAAWQLSEEAERARTAERDATDRLYHSSLTEAQAGRGRQLRNHRCRRSRGAVRERRSEAMSFGGHMRALREEAGLSRPELARRANVPVSTLRNWEGDRGFPNMPALLRLAKALGVRVERLAEGVEDPGEDETEAEEDNPP